MIKLLIMGQTLSLVTHKVVAGSHNYLEVDATFAGKDWEGLYKWVHFSKDQMHYVLPMHHDRIEKEDHLDLTGGTWEVYVHGNDILEDEITERITTNIQYLEVESTYDDHIFPALTPVFEEVLANEVEKAITIAQGVRNDADEGLFDGGTFFPEVSEEGVISWTNNRDLDNPEPRDIKGPRGDTGDKTVQVCVEEPTDPRINVWINPEGIVGKVIMDFRQISGTHQPGTYDVYLVTFSDDTTLELPIYNGADGDGTGDMLKSAYDPRNISQDVYQYAQNAARDAAAEATKNKAESEDLTAHIRDKNNPHEVTAEQLDLAAVATSGSYNDLRDKPDISGMFTAVYDVTPYTEIKAAYDEGMLIVCNKGDQKYMISRVANGIILFTHNTVGTDNIGIDLAKCEYDASNGSTTWSYAGQATYVKTNSITNGNDLPVTSGAVYTALQGKQDKLTIDSAMSAISTNPVQNRAIKQYIDSQVGGNVKIADSLMVYTWYISTGPVVNGSSAFGSPNVSKANYKALAVAGFETAMSGLHTTRCKLEGENLMWNVVNLTGATVTDSILLVNILYVKN